MTIAPLDLMLLLGAGQGFILTALLWFNRKGNPLSNRLLAALIGLLALASLSVGIPVANHTISTILDFVPLINVMPIGPILYFYSRSQLEPHFRIGKKERRHFYPIILDWGSQLIAWTFVISVLLGIVDYETHQDWGQAIDSYNTYADIPRWLSVTVYLILTWRWLLRQESRQLSDQQQMNRRWLRQILTVFLVFQGIWLLHLIPYILPQYRNRLLDSFGWYPIYIPIAVLIYWLGLRGYLHSRSVITELPAKKAGTTTLPNELILETTNRLLQSMAVDKLYLDPELTVEKVGRHLQIAPKTISAVLNQHIGKSFNTFVNEYRVEEVKRRFNEPGSSHLTLLGLAYECGFNSQATFQRTFKQFTQLAPNQYLSRQTTR